MFLQSPQCHPTSGHGCVRAPWKTEQQRTGGLEDYAQEKQWKLTCTPRFFFSLSLDFFYEHTEKLHTIFFYAPLVFLEQ